MMTFSAFGSIVAATAPGPMHLAGICIGSALVGSAAFLYQQQNRSQPSTRNGLTGANMVQTPQMASGLGASGMVMGMGAAATCLMPSAPMQLMFIPINIPLWIVTILYVGVDTYFLHSNSPIGHSAHLGGSIFGALYYFAYLRNRGGVWQLVRRGLRR